MKLNKLIQNLEQREKKLKEIADRQFQEHKGSFGTTNALQTRDQYMECWGRLVEIRSILDMLKMSKDLGAEE